MTGQTALFEERLTGQTADVFRVMADGRWHTLTGISVESGAPEASASARLRDIRRLGHTVEKRLVGRGIYEYRVTA